MHGPVLNSRVWQHAGQAFSGGGAARPAAVAGSRQDRTEPTRTAAACRGPTSPQSFPAPKQPGWDGTDSPQPCGRAAERRGAPAVLGSVCPLRAPPTPGSGTATAGGRMGTSPSRPTRRWEKRLLPSPLQSPPPIVRENGKGGEGGEEPLRGRGSPRLRPCPVRERPAARGKHPQLNHVHMTNPK